MNQNNLFQSSSYFKLDRAFFIRMLELEKLFHEKEIIISQIGELVGMYARCVEYYDSIKDDSKYYYMDKIQYVLSRKESLEQIFKEGAQQEQSTGIKVNNKPKDNLLISDFVIDLNFGDQNKQDREFRINNIRCSVAGKQQPRESVTRRKMQGEYKMNVDFYEHTNKQEYEVKHIVEETEKQFDENDQIVQKDLNNQDELLMQRIAKKKAKLNQKKKVIKRANSFDEVDFNLNGRNNTESTIEIKGGNENNHQTQIVTSTQNEDKQTPSNNDKPLSKKEQINELKETFDLSYSKLFTSISQQRNRASISRQQVLPKFNDDTPSNKNNIKMNLAASSVFETSQEELNRDSSTTNPINNLNNTQDHLESIFSAHGGRITIRGGNPFDESDDES